MKNKNLDSSKITNVVIINDFDYIQGGASKVAIQTANILKENNPELNVYFFSGCHKESSVINEGVIRLCTNQNESLNDKNKIRGIINNLYNIKAKKSLKKLLKSLDKNNTIIHIHGWTKVLSSSVFHIAYKMNFKVVLTMHDYFTACPNGGYFDYKKNMICQLKPLSMKCIKCNCDSRNYLIKIHRVIRQLIQNKIVKLTENLEYAISISDFSEKVLKKTLNKKTKLFRVSNPIDLDINTQKVDYRKNNYYLYAGRVSKEKGVDIFCEAITKSKQNGVVVGDGNELQRLKDKYKNIEFTGWKNGDEVKQYMKNAKALVIPSRWYEGAPLTPLEALQYGIPIISSDCNASVDYINDQNGIIFSIEKNNLSEILSNFSNEYKPTIENKNNYNEDVINVYNMMLK